MDAYGARSPLRDLAQVSVRDGRTLDVNVFDPNVAANVERAIRNAGLNLNPVADARGIRVPVPKVDRNAREALRKVGVSAFVFFVLVLTPYVESSGRGGTRENRSETCTKGRPCCR